MEEHELQAALSRHFGHETFREGQNEVIRAVLEGRDCLAVMPTGGGKSLCYQLPALLRDGVTLVVSPLIALMQDQVGALEARRIPATSISSALTGTQVSDRLRGMAAGRYRLVYVAPERFRSPSFLAALRGVRVSLFAVDEAHCVSMWGHDFRPDYLRLREALTLLGEPQVLALTATATPEVREDVTAQLGMGTAPRAPAEVVVRGFGRPGLTLAVSRPRSRDRKLQRLAAILRDHPVAIVYCATRKSVEWVARELHSGRLRCLPYHAGLPDDLRREAQERFTKGQVDVVVATNAFGMGIDRADVRAIVHWELPGSVEAYYQEAGRAGRDGKPARCEVLWSHADLRTQEFFQEGANPPPSLVEDVARLVRRAPLGVLLSAQDIADRMGQSRKVNGMAVDTALGLLERLGALGRLSNPEGPDAWEPGPDPEAPRPEDLARLEEKARRDRARLMRLVAYLGTQDCRHATILRYFGDPNSEGICLSRCDNCLGRAGAATVTVAGTGAGILAGALAPSPDEGFALGSPEGREPTEEEWLRIQKALSAVARLGGRFGRARVAQVLVGSRSQPVIQAGLDRIPSHGTLRGVTLDRVRDLLDALEDLGCLRTAGNEYPTLALTTLGAKVMRRQVALLVPWPASPTPPAPPVHGARSAGQASGGSSRRGGRAATAASEGLAPDPDPDPALFEALRAWRLTEARARGVPAYVVLTDRTLAELSRYRPRDATSLGTIKGIGPAKLAAYGEVLLDLLARQP